MVLIVVSLFIEFLILCAFSISDWFVIIHCMYCDIIIINNYCFTDGPSKTLISHDIYTDGQSCRLEALPV